MLKEKVQRAQQGNQQDMLELLEQFQPLLNKYSRKLMYEDALNDLNLKFIEIIHAINLTKLQNDNDGVFVKYIVISVRNAYIALLGEFYAQKGVVSWEDLTETEKHKLAVDEKSRDTERQRFIDLLDSSQNLTDKERQTLTLIYYYEYSAADIAKIFSTTRQNINQIKLRALEKIRKANPI